MEKKLKIVIAEDHTILRQGLRTLLSSNSNFEIVGEAEDGFEAIDCVEKFEPDLLLMDLSMPRMSGISAIKKIKKRYPITRIIALTVHKKEEYLLATIEAGADGYFLKDASYDELVRAIEMVMLGKPYFSNGLCPKVIERYMNEKKCQRSMSSWDTLSPREREVLILIAEGYKNIEIADELDISIKTVEKHRNSLMKKLDLRNAVDLTIYAM